jgi:hypothetical protein
MNIKWNINHGQYKNFSKHLCTETPAAYAILRPNDNPCTPLTHITGSLTAELCWNTYQSWLGHWGGYSFLKHCHKTQDSKICKIIGPTSLNYGSITSPCMFDGPTGLHSGSITGKHIDLHGELHLQKPFSYK